MGTRQQELMAEGKRQCAVCGHTKTLTDFSRDKSKSGGYEYRCKECAKSLRKSRTAQPGAWKWSKLREKYGLSRPEYERMLQIQNAGCALCLDVTDLQVDHCHVTGKVRGLLCGPCNRALALLNDNADTASRIAPYLAQ